MIPQNYLLQEYANIKQVKVQNLHYYLSDITINKYILIPNQTIVTCNNDLMSLLIKIERKFENFQFDYQYTTNNFSTFNKILCYIFGFYSTPNYNIKVSTSKKIKYSAIYLRKAKSSPKLVYDYNYNLECFFELNTKIYPFFDVDPYYIDYNSYYLLDNEQRNHIMTMHTIDNILSLFFRKFFYRGYRMKNYFFG